MQTVKNNSSEPYQFRRMFEPFVIKGLTLRNRIVFPAILTNYARPDGFITKGLIHYHEERAEHVGMNIVEVSMVRPKAGLSTRHIHIYDDKYIPGLAKLAQAIKGKGAAAVIQICDFGARAGSFGADADPVAPSPTRLAPKKARKLSVDEIKQFVVAFAEAARRAYDAGFDGVEIHACHMYLISQFLSPFINKRKDEYGGSVENRARLLLEIIEATKKRVPEGFLLLCRIDLFEPFEGGSTLGEVIERAQLLEKAGVDILNLSGICQKVTFEQKGKTFDWFTTGCPTSWPEGHMIKYAVQVKAAISAPTIAVGKIFSPQLAENILELGQADLVATARSLVADCKWPLKVKEGRDREILRCKEDLKCLRSLSKDKPMACAVSKSLPPKGINDPA
jgi:2,4-dienoyl-CoA reductase-like NADH-dependent reductase (Old Yellow Enzyme family)